MCESSKGTHTPLQHSRHCLPCSSIVTGTYLTGKQASFTRRVYLFTKAGLNPFGLSHYTCSLSGCTSWQQVGHCRWDKIWGCLLLQWLAQEDNCQHSQFWINAERECLQRLVIALFSELMLTLFVDGDGELGRMPFVNIFLFVTIITAHQPVCALSFMASADNGRPSRRCVTNLPPHQILPVRFVYLNFELNCTWMLCKVYIKHGLALRQYISLDRRPYKRAVHAWLYARWSVKFLFY